MRSDSICLIRKKRFPCIICDEPAEWLWEVALDGTPDVESGMIVSLPDIDLFLDDQISRLKDIEIQDPHAWLRGISFLIQKRFEEKRVTCRWQKIVSDQTEYTFSI